MASVGLMQRVDPPHGRSCKRRRPYQDAGAARSAPATSQQRTAVACTLQQQDVVDAEEETDEANGNSHSGSEYQEEDEDEDEDEAPTVQQQRRHQGRVVSRRSAGAGSRSWGGGSAAGYECLICGKSFSKACKLARHAATHTREKPFVCSEAG